MSFIDDELLEAWRQQSIENLKRMEDMKETGGDHNPDHYDRNGKYVKVGSYVRWFRGVYELDGQGRVERWVTSYDARSHAYHDLIETNHGDVVSARLCKIE